MIIKLLSVVSLLGAGLGFLSRRSTELGLCEFTEPTCINTFSHASSVLFYGFGALAVVFVALMLVPKAYFAWKEFAVWFLPPALAIFVTYKDVGGFGNFLPYAENVFRFLAATYIVCGLLVIIWSFFLKKGKGIKETTPVFMPANPVARLAWYAYIALMIFYVVAHYLAS